MRAQIFRSHRFLAKLLAVPVLLWAVSGLMHPFIANWFKPTIANKMLPATPVPATMNWLDPAKLMTDYAIPEVDQIHLAQVQGSWLYQVITPDRENRYFNTQTGQEVRDAEIDLVTSLAVAHAGLTVDQVLGVEKITEFSETYRSINRYLPVYQVSFDTPDKLYVLIDPVTQKLAAFSTQLTRVYRIFFAYAHNWTFLGKPSDPLRVTLMLVVVSLVAWVGLAGLFTYIVSRKKADGTKPSRPLHRRLHRFVGISTSVLFIMLSLSGALHIYSKYNFDWGFLENRPLAVKADELNVTLPSLLSQVETPVTGVSLARVGGKPAYRLATPTQQEPGATLYLSTKTGAVINEADSLYAKELATYFAGVEVEKASASRLLTQFGKTYPVIMKRLPVQQVRLEGAPYMGVTVDTANAHLAGRVSPAALFETMVFLNLHKFHFMDKLSKEGRDWLSVFSTLLILLTMVLGINLAIKKRAQRQAYAS